MVALKWYPCYEKYHKKLLIGKVKSGIKTWKISINRRKTPMPKPLFTRKMAYVCWMCTSRKVKSSNNSKKAIEAQLVSNRVNPNVYNRLYFCNTEKAYKREEKKTKPSSWVTVSVYKCQHYYTNIHRNWSGASCL